MPVLSRSASLTLCENGEVKGVVAGNLERAQPIHHVYLGSDLQVGYPYIIIQRDTRNQAKEMDKCYGAGSRVLMTVETCERKPQAGMVPVLALWADQDKSVLPMKASFIEGATDPSITYDPTTKRIHLYYWVNAWSPTGPREEPTTLFQSVKPPGPQYYDANYYPTVSSVTPPKNTYSAIRDLPKWFDTFDESVEFEQLNFEYPKITTEKVGQLRTNEMWIAPWTDGHLYRFGDQDPTPSNPLSPPLSLPSPPPPPNSPPPVFDGYNPPSILSQVPYAETPYIPVQNEVRDALYKLRSKADLKPTERATLVEYLLSPRRLGNLARTNRVLMRTSGYLVVGYKVEPPDNPNSTGGSIPYKEPVTLAGRKTLEYLIVDQPVPVYVTRRCVNKVMGARQKWVSFINGTQTFITAPMNYRYPGAASVQLSMGDPQVDFTVHDPSDWIDYWRRGLPLPKAISPQKAGTVPELDLVGPGYPLFALLSNPAIWSSY